MFNNNQLIIWYMQGRQRRGLLGVQRAPSDPARRRRGAQLGQGGGSAQGHLGDGVRRLLQPRRRPRGVPHARVRLEIILDSRLRLDLFA